MSTFGTLTKFGLILDGPSTSDAGPSGIHLAKTLKAMPHLTHLGLTSCPWSEERGEHSVGALALWNDEDPHPEVWDTLFETLFTQGVHFPHLTNILWRNMIVFPQYLFQFVHQHGETLKSIKIQYLGRDLDWDIEHPGILQFLNDIKLQMPNLDKLDAVWEFNTFYNPEWTWYKQETDRVL